VNNKGPLETQSGYTLIELSIGLVITSLAIWSGMLGVYELQERLELTKVVKQVSMSVDRIRQVILKDSDASFVTMPNITLEKYGIFTTANVINAGTANAQVYFALGLKLLTSAPAAPGVAAASDFYTNNVSNEQHFRFRLDGVKPSYCAELAGMLEGLASSMFLTEKDSNKWTTIKDSATPFSAQTARDVCGKEKDSFIWLEFRK
jgi:prepilin-type N-terminal cleavage/methylation domain-containing protein